MTQALNRDLNYRLTADPTKMESGFKSAEASARVFERELAKLEAQQKRVDDASSQVGRGLAIAGAVIGAGLALATRAAKAWQSQWTGVLKTVEGSPAQLAALEGELRGLARTLNVSRAHEQVAAVAEAAGQLGVKRQDIAAFTKTMIDLGVSTNLSATDAATAIARMSNIMGTAPADVRRLASALVALGNDGASTEQEIVDMALRIAGAGKVVGLTEHQVLAFANTLSSVGIEAEMGGSAISRVFIDIAQAARSGGDKLEAFAAVAGMTAADFRAAYQQDAAGAINAFVMGLGRMQSAGGDVFGTLESLNLSEIRVRDTLLRLASAGDLTTRSLQTGARAWDENIALTEEANRRYGTAEARLAGANNRLNDFAISMGQTFLPIVADTADMVGFLAEGLNSLPGPVKTALGVVGLFAAALLLTGGAALTIVPKIHQTRQAIETLRNSSSGAAAATGKVAGILTGPWGLAIAGAITLLTMWASRQAAARARSQEFASTLDDVTGAVTESSRAMIARKLIDEGLAAAAEKLGVDIATLTDVVLGDADAMARWNEVVEQQNVLTPEQLKALHRVTSGVDEQGEAFAQGVEEKKKEIEATRGVTDATKALPPEQRRLADALGLTAEQAQAAGKEIDNLDKELRALFDSLFGLEEAQDAVASGFADLTEKVNAAKEAHDRNATSLTGNSKTAIENRAAVRDLVRGYSDMIVEQAKAGATTGELTAAASNYKTELIKQLTAMGFSEAEAKTYAAALDRIPGAVATTINTSGMDTALAKARNLVTILNNVPRDIEIRPRVGRIIGFQHGGFVNGPPGPDRMPAMLTAREFVSTVAATSRNRAALEAANAGARLMVVGGASAGVAPAAGSGAGAAVAAGGGGFSERSLARAVARALDGATLVVDDRGRGRLEARQADLYRRGG